MIILGDVIEPRASAATSTYPAVISGVGNSTDAYTTLYFYCPSIMAGEPYEAYNSLATNHLDAPRYAHRAEGNNDEYITYTYQRGDVIIISFADGNLRSPQFVRYIPLDDDTRKTNVSYLDGNPVVTDLTKLFFLENEDMTLQSEELKKAVSLLKYVRIAATGKNINSFENYKYNSIEPFELQYIANGNDNDFSIRKCGRYGAEIIAGDANFSGVFLNIGVETIDDWTLEKDGTEKMSRMEVPTISFFNMAQYFFSRNGVVDSSLSEDAKKKLNDINNFDSFQNSNNMMKVYAKTIKDLYELSSYEQLSLSKPVSGEEQVQYLFSVLAGFKEDWKTGYSYINSKSEIPKSIPIVDDAILSMWDTLKRFYEDSKRNDTQGAWVLHNYKLFRRIFWRNFDEAFKNEMDRAYAIALSQNLYTLKKTYNLDTLANLALVIVAVIITAYPLLQKITYNPSSNSENNRLPDDFNSTYKSFLQELMTNDVMIKPEFYTNVSYIRNKKKSYFEQFIDVYFCMLRHNDALNFEESRKILKENISVCIDEICNNAGSILNLLREKDWNTEFSDNNTGETQPPPPAIETQGGTFEYYPTTTNNITSSFGWRSRGYHYGVDFAIGSNGSFWGKPIYAVLSGTVEKVKRNYKYDATPDSNGGYGNCFYVNHGEINGKTVKSFYAHCSYINVNDGDKVEAGQKIANVGCTGSCSPQNKQGSHLHFGVRESEKWVNPMNYF